MEITLGEYLDTVRRDEASQELGLTTDGLYKMANSNRQIYVQLNARGAVVDAYEIKGVGRFRYKSRKGKFKL